MSEERPVANPLGDAMLALHLFALAPQQMGGIVLRGGGPARDLLVDLLKTRLLPDHGWWRLPSHIDDERLLGGVDIPASLAAGRPVMQRGLLAEAAGGIICVPMAERLREEVSGRLVQAMDTGSGEDRFALVLLDDGMEDDQRPPPALCERSAMLLDLSQARSLDLPEVPDMVPLAHARKMLARVAPGEDDYLTIARVAEAFGIDSVRILRFALLAARAHAALFGREVLAAEDIQAAARLVMAPRATRLPETAEPPPEDEPEDQPDEPDPPPEQPPEQPEDQPDDPADTDEADQLTDAELEELILEAVQAAIPDDILARIAEGKASRAAGASGSGRKTRSKMRGRPLGALPGDPRSGARLALIDTLRAAAPWQTARRAGAPPEDRRVRVHKDDLRVRRFEDRTSTVTIFAVDASGSAAFARLAEAKGAVELILAQAYVKRTEVALLAFRSDKAELLLPPTRSLTRARRALASLPGGGGTPLAAGMLLARQVAEGVTSKGQTPFLVFLTDGSANIALDGTPGRRQAREDVQDMARTLAAAGLESLVIDISPRPRPDAEALAKALHGRYLPLPMGDAGALEKAVSKAQMEATA